MGEVVQLHEYFTTCPNCNEAVWYIKWNQQCTDVTEIICACCSYIIENPTFNNQPYEFEIDDFDEITDIEFEETDELEGTTE